MLMLRKEFSHCAVTFKVLCTLIFFHVSTSGRFAFSEFCLKTFFYLDPLILFKVLADKPHICITFLSNVIFAWLLVILGDPRRPYPQDIEMRSGWLGRLMEGVPSETDQPVTGDSTLQELMQPLLSASHVSQPVGGLGRFIFSQEH